MKRGSRKRLLRRVQLSVMQNRFRELGADKKSVAHSVDVNVPKPWQPHEPETLYDYLNEHVTKFLYCKHEKHDQIQIACARCSVKYLQKDLERIGNQLVCWKCE
jgi:hypothetical protein